MIYLVLILLWIYLLYTCRVLWRAWQLCRRGQCHRYEDAFIPVAALLLAATLYAAAAWTVSKLF